MALTVFDQLKLINALILFVANGKLRTVLANSDNDEDIICANLW